MQKDISLEKINIENYVAQKDPSVLKELPRQETSESLLKDNKKHFTSMSKNPRG